MKVQIPVIRTEDVSKKLVEIFKKQNPELSEEEKEELRTQRIIKGEDYTEEKTFKKPVLTDVNLDEISRPIDLHFKLSEVVSIYKAPEVSEKSSMVLVIGVNEYQAIFNQEQYDKIVDYLDKN